MPTSDVQGSGRPGITDHRNAARRPDAAGRTDTATTAPGTAPAETRSYEYAKDYCRTVVCPQCHRRVFFLRHASGAAWINELQWPWPWHACMDGSTEAAQAVAQTSRNAESLKVPRAGIVLGVTCVPGKHEGCATIAVPPHEPEDWNVLGVPDPFGLIGAVVAFSPVEHILVHRGLRYRIAVPQRPCVKCRRLVPISDMEEHLRTRHGLRVCPECRNLVGNAAFPRHHLKCRALLSRPEVTD